MGQLDSTCGQPPHLGVHLERVARAQRLAAALALERLQPRVVAVQVDPFETANFEKPGCHSTGSRVETKPGAFKL